MKIEINEKPEAFGGKVHDPRNFDNGEGFYHFHCESILVLWDGGTAKGPLFTTMGKEPYSRDPRPPKDGKKPMVVFAEKKNK
mgnify:CR=1 FL=1